MNRFLERLRRRHEGTDDDWTPKQLKDQIDGKRGVDMRRGLEQHPPTDDVLKQKNKGIVRTTKKDNGHG